MWQKIPGEFLSTMTKLLFLSLGWLDMVWALANESPSETTRRMYRACLSHSLTIATQGVITHWVLCQYGCSFGTSWQWTFKPPLHFAEWSWTSIWIYAGFRRTTWCRLCCVRGVWSVVLSAVANFNCHFLLQLFHAIEEVKIVLLLLFVG